MYKVQFSAAVRKITHSATDDSVKAQPHSKLEAFKKARRKENVSLLFMKGCLGKEMYVQREYHHMSTFHLLFHLSYCYVSPDGSQDGRRPDAQHEQFPSGHRPLPLRLWRPETFTRQWR